MNVNIAIVIDNGIDIDIDINCYSQNSSQPCINKKYRIKKNHKYWQSF